jgi:hypothetical protein
MFRMFLNLIALSVLFMGTAFCMNDIQPRERSQSSPAEIGFNKNLLTQDQQDLYHLVQRGDFNPLKDFVINKKINTNFVCESGRTLLHVAMAETSILNFNIVKFLVKVCNLNVKATDRCGNTPLHILACRHFCNNSVAQKCAELLLKNGAEINAKMKNEWTPLDFACTTCAETIAFFMNKGGISQRYPTKEQLGKKIFEFLDTTSAKSTCAKKIPQELGRTVRFIIPDKDETSSSTTPKKDGTSSSTTQKNDDSE